MRAVFLDRDGVINELVYYEEAGIIDSPFTPEQFRLLLGVGKAIKSLNELGYKVLVVSNQPGVAKRHFTVDALTKMDEKMEAELKEEGAHLDKIYYCLHHPEATNPEYRMACQCRKPEPGMLLQAAVEFRLDLAQCYMVGDNLSDIKAGQRAGCQTILVGKMKCELCGLMQEQGIKPDAIAGNLLEAVQIVVEPGGNGLGGGERITMKAGR